MRATIDTAGQVITSVAILVTEFAPSIMQGSVTCTRSPQPTFASPSLQVEQRMLACLQNIVLPSLTVGGPPAVVVSHGFAIKCTLRGILQSNPAMTRKVGWRCDQHRRRTGTIPFTPPAAPEAVSY
jgi:hypothetical protein